MDTNSDNKRRIKIQMTGTVEDNGNIRLDDFIKQLDLLKEALKQVSQVVTGNDTNSVYYKVISISHFSPTTVELEGASNQDDELDIQVTQDFFAGLQMIVNQTQAPAKFNYDALKAIQDLPRLVKEAKISRLSLLYKGLTVELDNSISDKIEDIFGPDTNEISSVVGTLKREGVESTFYIYPTTRLGRVICKVPEDLHNDFVKAVGKRVEAYGKLSYKNNQYYPYKIIAKEIEVYPPQSELPKMADLRGLEPNILKGLSVEEFVRNLRDDWN